MHSWALHKTSSPELAEDLVQDQEGTVWHVFGEAVSGPRQGEKLTPVNSFIGYWLAWGAFYPNLDIY